MKTNIKRALTLLLSMAMVLSMTTWASAADYGDMPTGWSKEAMEAAVENGLLRGDNLGRLNPKGLLTRSQMAAVVTRALGAEVADDLSAYSDMDSGAWYYEAVAQAAHMSVMAGYDGKMSPERNITRQEAFTVLARALKLDDGTSGTLWRFSDADQVAGWATGPIAAMVSAGYVNGSGGRLNPTGNITREEFAQVMHNIFGTYLNSPGTYTQVSDHSLMISAPGVTVKGVTVHGDVIIGDGVSEGDITLDRVNVEGRLVVRGGGVNSIHIINSTASQILISKVDGNVRVAVDQASSINIIMVMDGKDDVVVEGSVTKLVVESDTPVVVKDASIETVEVTAPNATLSLTGRTTVDSVEINEQAQGVRVDTDATVTIKTVKADNNVTLTGQGTVQKTEGEGKVADESGKEIVTTTTPPYTPPYTPSYPPTDTPTPPTPTPHTHTWDDGEITTEASRGGDDTPAAHGVYTYTCTCGETKTETLHPWVAANPDHPACLEVTDLTCPVEGCGQTTKGKVSHTIVMENPVDATCTTPGHSRHVYCSVCSTVINEKTEIPALGHKGPWETVKTPTATEAGEKTRRCMRCNETETETIPALGDTAPVATGFTLVTNSLKYGICIRPTMDSEGMKKIFKFEFRLSSDGGTTWQDTAPYRPGFNDDQAILTLAYPGTYNKLKIISVDYGNRTAEAVFDCNLKSEVQTGGNARAIFVKDDTDSDSYFYTISGFHRTPSPTSPLSFCLSIDGDGTGTSGCSIYAAAEGEAFSEYTDKIDETCSYIIYEVKELTIDGTNATIICLQGERALCFPDSDTSGES